MDDNWNTDNQDNNYYSADNDQRDYHDKPRSKGRNVFVSYKQNNQSTHPNEEVFYGSPQQTGTVYEVNSRPKPKRKRKALKIIIPIVVVILIIGFISNAFDEYEEITKSTYQREALAAGSVNKTSYLSDETGWMKDQSDALEGLREFYKKTGVQPYLYVTNSIEGYESPTTEDLDVFANTLYDELFTDEAHLLLVFYYYDQEYLNCCLRGAQANTVIDDEATNILLDYIDRYYYDDTLTISEFFGKAFSSAAGRIMTVTKSPLATVIIVIGLAVILTVAFFWWRYSKKQKAKEDQQMEDILDTPLEKFGDLEVEELADKYEDTDESL